MGSIGELYQEVSTLVLEMWSADPKEIAYEVEQRYGVTSEYALELVEKAIEEELALEKSLYEEEDYLFDWDGDALASAGFGTDEDYL
jgi:hypothetical protein